MTEERPRRAILKLKLPVNRPLGPDAMASATEGLVAKTPAPAPAEPAVIFRWKCKPCGTAFGIPDEAGDADIVRCPACNAKLGVAADFRAEPPNLEKVRARQVKK